MAEFQFIEETHEYILNGEKIPSITEICKPLSIYAAENANVWLRDIAAKRGTRIHDLCSEVDFNGGCGGLAFDYDYAGYVKAYLNFLRDYQIKSWLGVETMVCSGSLGVAGTVDRIGILDERLLVLDIKTGTKIDVPLLTAQLMGYCHVLLAEDCNFKIQAEYDGVKLLGLQLKKDGNYRIFTCEKCSIFMHLHRVYEERRRLLCKN